jgi:hypothetical protein
MFFENGLAVVSEIRSLSDPGSPPPSSNDSSIITKGLQQIAERIRALPIGSVAAAAAAGLPNILSKPGGPAFEWITHLCVLYIAACSLGLDPDAQERVRHRIQNWEVLLDTDVVLSLLGTGEPEHEATLGIVKAWRSFDGHLFAPEPVAREVAYHAEIATREYKKWQASVRRRQRLSARRKAPFSAPPHPPDTNVFLRSFIARSAPEYSASYWRVFIANFLDPSGQHTLRTQRFLQQEYVLLPASDDGIDLQFAAVLSREMLERRGRREQLSQDTAQEFHRRCECDGRLIAILAHRRAALKHIGKTAYIVSSSSHLRAVCIRHTDRLGLQSPVLAISRLSFALALLPSANLDLNVLRSVLFESAFARHVSHSYAIARKLMDAQQRNPLNLAGCAQLEELMEQQIAGSQPQLPPGR